MVFNNFFKILNNGKYLEFVVIMLIFLKLVFDLGSYVFLIKGFCFSYLFESFWLEINVMEYKKMLVEEDLCKLYMICWECVFFGGKGRCFWCESY